MFDKDFDNQFKEFDKTFKKAQKFAVGWFIFVALLSISLLSGLVFVVYKLMLYFGVM